MLPTFFHGIKFGMLLQIAIGPVSLFILTTAINSNFINSFLAVLAVALVDAIYIILALLGAVSFLHDKKNEAFFKWLSAIILVFFGVDILLDTLGIHLLPASNIISTGSVNSSFIYAFILTLSSPLTILFWVGIFSERIAEKQYKNKDLYYFALGCLSSTLIFLTSLSFIGSTFHYILPTETIIWLNVIAGLTMIYFGIRIFRPKTA
jgi:threonine/homoserine/homoserine lactone efflux protein